MKSPFKSVVIISVLLLALASPAAAQISFELGFGWTIVAPAMNSNYVNTFTPPLTPDAYYISSTATQTLNMRSKISYGMNGFFNVFVTKNLGIQVLADYHKPGLKGNNSAYDLTLNYQTFEPRVYEKYDDEWPDTSGNFTMTSFSLNALARFRVAPNLAVSFSAGPSMFHISGKASGLAYSSFTMDYDGTTYALSGKTYKMVYEFGPDTTYGFNIGTEAAVTIFRNVILAVDVRWFQSTKATCDMKLVASDVITEPLDEIEAAINLGSIRIDPSYFRTGLVLRFQF